MGGDPRHWGCWFPSHVAFWSLSTLLFCILHCTVVSGAPPLFESGPWVPSHAASTLHWGRRSSPMGLWVPQYMLHWDVASLDMHPKAKHGFCPITIKFWGNESHSGKCRGGGYFVALSFRAGNFAFQIDSEISHAKFRVLCEFLAH